jgi:hypothetical protein
MRFIAPDLANELSASFDMYREFSNCSLEAAATFYYLEHLLRATTSDEEVVQAEPHLSKSTSRWLREVHRRPNYVYENLQMLYSSYTWEDLGTLPPLCLEVFIITPSGLKKETKWPEQGARWPLGFIVQAESRVFSLYTSGMTLVDCIDPVTAEKTHPLLTVQVVNSVRRSLYKEMKTNSLGIQTDFMDYLSQLDETLPPSEPLPAEAPKLSLQPLPQVSAEVFTMKPAVEETSKHAPECLAPESWEEYSKKEIPNRRREDCSELSNCRML